MFKKIIGLLALTLAANAPVHANPVNNFVCEQVADLTVEAAVARDRGVPMEVAVTRAISHPIVLDQKMADTVPSLVYMVYVTVRTLTPGQIGTLAKAGCVDELTRNPPPYRR